MRQQSRIVFRSIFRIKVYDTRNLLIGYVADVSETGLRLLSDSLMESGTDMTLRLKMRVGEDKSLQMDVNATCMWARENEKTGHFEAGFALINGSAEYSKLVRDLRVTRGAR